jgi:hypothetical protein
MQNIPTKSTGDSYTAAEFNEHNDELKNSITDSGQSLSGADDFQISKSMSVNAAGADFYIDTGAANAYVVSTIFLRAVPISTGYFEGMRVRFRPTNNNTGASTVNVTSLGVKSILKADGVTALSAGDLTTADDVQLRYDITAGAFLLGLPAPEATQTARGITFLNNQKITLANNTTDPSNDIDFSGGRFIYSDGTGDQIVSALIKQLDAVFLAGTNQGGLDVLPKAIDTTYHCFAVHNPTTGVSDYAFSVTVGGPTLVGNLVGFTKSERIFSIMTDGSGNIIPFYQVDKTCYLKTRITDATGGGAIGIVATPLTLSTPLNLEVLAIISAKIGHPGIRNALFTALDDVDLPPTQANSDIGITANAGNSDMGSIVKNIKTDTSSQIRTIVDVAVTDYELNTLGWIDYQLRD